MSYVLTVLSMIGALKDVLLEVYCNKLLNDVAIMSKSSNTSNNNNNVKNNNNLNSTTTNSDQALYVGPYKLEKTLGKGQTGKYCKCCVWSVLHRVILLLHKYNDQYSFIINNTLCQTQQQCYYYYFLVTVKCQLGEYTNKSHKVLEWDQLYVTLVQLMFYVYLVLRLNKLENKNFH